MITDLEASQTVTSNAAISSLSVRTSDGIVTATSQKRTAVEVRYDATNKSYTVIADARSQTFSPNDIRNGTVPGEVRYARLGASNDYLTLVTTPYYGTGASNRYVGMGYWQRNEVAGGNQTTQFSTFAYGLAAVAGAVPRTGAARWATDIFGLLTVPAEELRTVQGRGNFDVDFGTGVGSLRFRAGGQLGSGSAFSGDFSYASGRSGTLGGQIAGQFYGPAAEEVGAAFNAAGNGTVLSAATASPER